MKSFERDDMVLRISIVSRIERTWLRRLWLIVLFVPLLAANWIMAAVYVAIMVPLMGIRHAALGSAELIRTTMLRWNTRKED